MGTGIVSIALDLDHVAVVSSILLVVAALVWAVLGILLVGRISRNPAGVRRDARSPAALTAVAASAVLGARVIELTWVAVAAALLVLATASWVMLLNAVLRHWKRPGAGVAFMVVVSTESLAVLSAELAARERAPWLLYAAVAACVLGLVFYPLVLRGFGLRQLFTGQGDHWVSGGALAIPTLAATRIALAIPAVHELGSWTPALRTVTLVLWVASVAWLPALLAGEVVRPRLRYDVRRWATVFPLGMYAACSFATGAVARVPAVSGFARAWTWVTLVVWLIVFATMVWRGVRLLGRLILRRPPRPGPPRLRSPRPGRPRPCARRDGARCPR